MKGSFKEDQCRYTHRLVHVLILVLLCLPSFNNVFTVLGNSMTPCNGSIAECYVEEEMLMESEISRRFLEQQKKYISYDTLKKDQPACQGGKGKPYTKSESCLPPPSNPYDRGCKPIYRCKS
ncbi:protein RALF-like 32 [Momordica charantia]|uniref:Protein RALF-like 32 n=1 Tax=Momordica charantia TaxID=3673 RepID=A0A6J1C8Z5_MOMCH|nr:protein RALF-like 32 [Momordica charantia]